MTQRKIQSSQILWLSGGGELIDDTSPQLGGTLETNGFDINLSSSGSVISATIGVPLKIQPIDSSGTTPGQVSLLGGGNTGNAGLVLVKGGWSTAGEGGDVQVEGGRGDSGVGGDVVFKAARGSTAAGRIKITPNAFGSFTTAPALDFLEDNANGTNYVALKGPASITTNRTWTLPQDDPSTVSGQFLTTDASGILSFSTAGGGVDIEDEGTSVQTGVTTLDFAGAGVTVTQKGGSPANNDALVTVGGITNLGDTNMDAASTFDFTSWPTGIKGFRVYFRDVNMSSSANDITLRLRTSGGVVTTGYDSVSMSIDAGVVTTTTSTTTIAVDGASGLGIVRGYFEGQLLDDTTDHWAVTGTFYDSADDLLINVWSNVDLGSALFGFRIQSQNGANFTAGDLSIQYWT